MRAVRVDPKEGQQPLRARESGLLAAGDVLMEVDHGDIYPQPDRKLKVDCGGRPGAQRRRVGDSRSLAMSGLSRSSVSRSPSAMSDSKSFLA